MILVGKDNGASFTGFVNQIIEKEYPNGGHGKVYLIGTNETWQDESKHYSSWFCRLGGDAKNTDAEVPLLQGDRIRVNSWKMTNESKLKEDGTYGPNMLNTTIFSYEVLGHKEGGHYTDFNEPRDLTKFKKVAKKAAEVDPFAGLDD